MTATERSDLPPLTVVRLAPPPAPDARGADYADNFALRLLSADDRTAEEWARAGLEQAPTWMRRVIVVAHRGVLQFRPAAAGEPQILGWRITASSPDTIRLDTDGWLMSATIVAHRDAPTVGGIATYLRYQRPSARHVWRIVGPLHRYFAPRLLAGAARRFGHPARTVRTRLLYAPPPADR